MVNYCCKAEKVEKEKADAVVNSFRGRTASRTNSTRERLSEETKFEN